MTDKNENVQPVKDQPIQIEGQDDPEAFDAKNPRPAVVGFTGKHAELYTEALERYGQDGSIDPGDEKRLKRKIDRRILPLLGICYFFYCMSVLTETNDMKLTRVVDVDKTTLSYAAIFGIRDDLNLTGEEYSWLSSVFYFGWLIWAIPSNLIMQRCPPAWYLSFNIFM
jgi:hypothetical protein